MHLALRFESATSYHAGALTGAGPCTRFRAPVSTARHPDEASLASRSLEELTFERLQLFLGRLQGRRVPGLYKLILAQVERALLRAALAQTGDHLGQTAQLLDVDRNTLSRKARALGLPISAKPGPKSKRPRGGP